MFKRKKQQQEEIGTALGEVQRYTELANQLTAKTASGFGVDLDALTREATAAMAGGGQQQMMAYAARVSRVSQHGLEMPATVRSLELGQPSPLQGGVPAQLTLTVEPPAGAPYDASTDQVLADQMATALAVGQRVTVKVDPDDPHSLVIWAAEPARTDTTSSADRIERLTKLQELRSTGVLTEAEFEAHKAKLLGE